jgi:adenylyl-sulfate kinase
MMSTPASAAKAGTTVWFTGLPASGKSTLAELLRDHLVAAGEPCLILDGDVLRAGLSRDLGFSPADRAEQSRRAAEIALLCNRAGMVAIVALVSPSGSARAGAKACHGTRKFVEVFVDCPASVCRVRDPKGLYAQAEAGEILDFTGVSAPYEAPAEPAVHVRTDQQTAEEAFAEILSVLNV